MCIYILIPDIHTRPQVAALITQLHAHIWTHSAAEHVQRITEIYAEKLIAK